MLTTSQAAARGVSRLQISRLAQAGHLEQVGHGIYRDAGAPPERFEAIKAGWLSVNPRMAAQDRLSARPLDAVVSGAAAAHLLGLGDLVPEPYEFTVPARRQTQRGELAFRHRTLPPESLTWREGLPVTTPEQTIADLVEARADRSLVAGVLADAESADLGRLAELLSPLAARNGFGRNDGAAFCAELERLAGRDAESLARSVAGTDLARRVAAEYLKAINPRAAAALAESLRPLTRAVADNPAPRVALDARAGRRLAEIAQRTRLSPQLGAATSPAGAIGDECAAS
jgi:hypothetical protein